MVRMNNVFLPVALSAAFVVGCSNPASVSKSSSSAALTADMSGATSLAVTSGSSGQLMKMTSGGEIESVLNLSSLAVYHTIVTDTHIVVSGQFDNITAANGSSLNCGLIAFPKAASGERVNCLYQGQVGTYSAISDSINNSSYDDYGFTSLGSAVYFVAGQWDKTRLLKWDGSSNTVETLIEINVGTGEPGFSDVHISANGQNICAVRPALNSFKGAITCGAVGSGSFSNLNLGTTSVTSGVNRVGNSLLTYDKRVNLDTLVVTTITPLDAPVTRAMAVATSATEIVGIVQNVGLVRIDETGASTVIDSSTDWTRIIGSGNYIYVYGGSGSVLKRMALNDSSLGATNYLSTYNMLALNSMSVSVDGATSLIRLEGTGGSGHVTTLLIDSATGSLHSATVDLPALISVIQL